jgi:hypothetical protein
VRVQLGEESLRDTAKRGSPLAKNVSFGDVQGDSDCGVLLASNVASHDDFALTRRKLIECGPHHSFDGARIEWHDPFGKRIIVKRARLVDASYQLAASPYRFGIESRARETLSRHLARFVICGAYNLFIW